MCRSSSSAALTCFRFLNQLLLFNTFYIWINKWWWWWTVHLSHTQPRGETPETQFSEVLLGTGFVFIWWLSSGMLEDDEKLTRSHRPCDVAENFIDCASFKWKTLEGVVQWQFKETLVTLLLSWGKFINLGNFDSFFFILFLNLSVKEIYLFKISDFLMMF